MWNQSKKTEMNIYGDLEKRDNFSITHFKKKWIIIPFLFSMIFITFIFTYGEGIRGYLKSLELKKYNGVIQHDPFMLYPVDILRDVHYNHTKDRDKWRVFTADTILKEKDIIKTGRRGRLDLILDKGIGIRMESKTKIILDELIKKVSTKTIFIKIELKYGSLISFLSELTPDSTYIVSTQNATIEAKGTIFDVTVDKDETKISVLQGEVNVIPALKRDRVFAVRRDESLRIEAFPKEMTGGTKDKIKIIRSNLFYEDKKDMDLAMTREYFGVEEFLNLPEREISGRMYSSLQPEAPKSRTAMKSKMNYKTRSPSPSGDKVFKSKAVSPVKERMIDKDIEKEMDKRAATISRETGNMGSEEYNSAMLDNLRLKSLRKYVTEKGEGKSFEFTNDSETVAVPDNELKQDIGLIEETGEVLDKYEEEQVETVIEDNFEEAIDEIPEVTEEVVEEIEEGETVVYLEEDNFEENIEEIPEVTEEVVEEIEEGETIVYLEEVNLEENIDEIPGVTEEVVEEIEESETVVYLEEGSVGEGINEPQEDNDEVFGEIEEEIEEEVEEEVEEDPWSIANQSIQEAIELCRQGLEQEDISNCLAYAVSDFEVNGETPEEVMESYEDMTKRLKMVNVSVSGLSIDIQGDMAHTSFQVTAEGIWHESNIYTIKEASVFVKFINKSNEWLAKDARYFLHDY